MAIQVFGKGKCFDTKKAERWFKERGVKFQSVDLIKFGMSQGELKSVIQSVGIDNVIDTQAKGYAESLLPYTSSVDGKIAYLLENQAFIKTPIVRNGKKATIGIETEIWSQWIKDGIK